MARENSYIRDQRANENNFGKRKGKDPYIFSKKRKPAESPYSCFHEQQIIKVE